MRSIIRHTFQSSTSFPFCRNSLIESEAGSDVIFLVGSEPDVQRIPAHSWILAESNPVFKAMFRGPLNALRAEQQQQEDDDGEHAHFATRPHPTAHETPVKLYPDVCAAKGRSAAVAFEETSFATATVGVASALDTPPATHRTSSASRRRATIAVSDVDGRAFDILLR